ncbi:hypothetical protein B0J12DRAFT_390875 [Macrophomina phaseolina]|uniref:Integral membrane protein n=1 Tax=Macrophomina phaseolina TaxID=35725 RepID=A0ABQ8FV84_9PEZI|nr:hypothetical protein B0J12DRAFT_390875 [Macrophomina phaseolina]
MLSPAVHQALPWAFFTIALISFILRVSIHQRYKRALDRRLLNGDFAALAALLILFAHDVLAVITTRSLTYLSDNPRMQSRDHRPDLAEVLSGLLKRQLPLTLLFTSGLWAVKFEFLYLLYSLVVNLRSLHRAWLCVFAATVFTYLTSLLCYPISTVDCDDCPARTAVHLSLPLVRYNAAWDVITDFLIVALPQALAMGSSATSSVGFAASVSFVLARLPMIFAILRAAISRRDSLVSELLWLNTWASIQISMSITLSNLMALRQLRAARRMVTGGRTRTGSPSLHRHLRQTSGGRWPSLILSRWSWSTFARSRRLTEIIHSPYAEEGHGFRRTQ